MRIMLAAMLGAWCSAQPCGAAGLGPAGPMSEQQKKLLAEYGRIANEYFSVNNLTIGEEYTRKIVEEFPGRMEVVRPALWRLARQWMGRSKEYAHQRIVALHRSGDVPGTDPVVHEAYIARASTLAKEGQTLRAAQVMAEVGRLMDHDIKWCCANAKLHYDVGSYHAPRLLYELAFDLQRRRDDPKLREVVEVFWPTERDSGAAYRRSAQSYRRGPLSVAAIRIRGDDDARWFISPKRPLRGMGGAIDRLIAESLKQVELVAWDDEANQADPWLVIDQHLLRRKPGGLSELRKVQEDAWRSETGNSNLARLDTSRLLAIYRRYPWAASGQRALVAYGRMVLWAGRPRAAIRSFRDVLAHATAPAVRDTALTGLWLALAQVGSRSGLAAAFEGVDPGKTFKWMGRAVKAGEIQRELSAGLADPPAPPAGPELARLTRRVVRVPAVSPWPVAHHTGHVPRPNVDMQFAGADVLLSAPNVLARYSAADCTEPLWQRTARSRANLHSWMVGRFRPAIAGGLIYTRWGYQNISTDLAAVDMRTGRLVWCTSERPTWWTAHSHRPSPVGIQPLNDPVVADGRLYVLGHSSRSARDTRRQHHHRSGQSVSLFCLDASGGAVLWETPLRSAQVGWSIRSERAGIDHTTWFGMPVTIHDGAVYCVSNAGQVARCDLRDGRLAWLYEYPRSRRGVPIRGVGPLLVGDKLLVRPRDHRGVFALDSHTGRMIWHNAFARPTTAIGVLDGALLVHSAAVMASLDIDTGKVRWFDRMEDGIIGPGRLIGRWIYSGTPEALTRRDGLTGAVVERLDWPKDAAVQSFAIHNDTLYTVTDETCAVGNVEIGRPLNTHAPAEAPVLTFPLEQAWQVPRAAAKLYVPPPEANLGGKVYLVSGSIMECLDATPRGSVGWRRFVRPGARQAWFHEGKLLMMYQDHVEARNARTGVPLAKIAMPMEMRHTRLWRVGSMWLHKRGTFYGAMDMASGRVLWQQNHSGYTGRPNWAPDAQPYWDGKNFHFLTQTWGDTNLTRHVVMAGSDGRLVSSTDITPVRDGRPTTTLYGKGRSVFEVDNNKLYRYALDGKQAALLPNVPPGSRLAGYDSPFVLLNTTDTKTKKKHQLVLRDDDPNYVYRCEDDFVGKISDGKLSTMLAAAGKISIVDLARKKEVFRCQLPEAAKDERRKKYLLARFWQTGPALSVLSVVSDKPRVDVFDAASGAHKGGQVLHGMRGSGQTAQVAGVLLIVDQTGLHAWTAAYGRKKPVRFLADPS